LSPRLSEPWRPRLADPVRLIQAQQVDIAEPVVEPLPVSSRVGGTSPEPCKSAWGSWNKTVTARSSGPPPPFVAYRSPGRSPERSLGTSPGRSMARSPVRNPERAAEGAKPITRTEKRKRRRNRQQQGSIPPIVPPQGHSPSIAPPQGHSTESKAREHSAESGQNPQDGEYWVEDVEEEQTNVLEEEQFALQDLLNYLVEDVAVAETRVLEEEHVTLQDLLNQRLASSLAGSHGSQGSQGNAWQSAHPCHR